VGSRSPAHKRLEEFDGLEEEVGGAIAPDRLEFDEDAPLGAETVLGERGREETGNCRWSRADVSVRDLGL
jgi:hypothetical protein